MAHTPQLHLLPTPYGREPVPESYAPGAKVFHAAYDQAVGGKYEVAANGFLEAAGILVAPKGNQYENSMRAARGVAYHNAWEGFQAAGKAEAGKEKLEKAAKADEALAAEIKKLLKG